LGSIQSFTNKNNIKIVQNILYVGQIILLVELKD